MSSETHLTPSGATPTGKMIIFTAPSGAGKTTIVRHLLEKFPELCFSISATTRKRREHEVDGKDYYFLTEERFRQRVEQGDFLEWEEVYAGSCYGTLKMEVERIWAQNRTVIFDVDVKGALNIISEYQQNALSVFVRPPSVEALEERLRKRQTEDDESFRKRIDRASHELGFAARFDYELVNDDLQVALKEAEEVIGGFLHSGRVENGDQPLPQSSDLAS